MAIQAKKSTKQATNLTALRKSERWLRTFLEHSYDAIVLTSADGQTIYASPSIQRVIGYTPEEYLAHNGAELMHPAELKPGEAQSLQAHDLEREAPVRRPDALVWLPRLLLEPRLELVGDRDAGELVGTDVARARHGQEHDTGHDGRRQAAATTVRHQLLELQHVPADLRDETMNPGVLLLRHLQVLIHRLFFTVLER